jgi:hypothetical protein
MQDEWKWNMEPFFDFKINYGSLLAGKWRITVRLDFKEGGKHEIECVRYYGEIRELD